MDAPHTKRIPVPRTAREVLAAFYPAHGDHTARTSVVTPKFITLTCTCDDKVELLIGDNTTHAQGWTLDEIKHAVRNVPPPPH